jgi:hypothetical protein
VYPYTATPSLGATISDPRGDQVRGVFYAWYYDSSGKQHYVLNAAVGPWYPSGTTFAWQVPNALADQYYYWNVRTQNSDGAFSSYSATQHFRVNTHCTGGACHVGADDTDVGDENAQDLEAAITIPSLAQTQVDGAWSTAWIFASLRGGFEFQVGPTYGRCPNGQAEPFSQVWDMNDNPPQLVLNTYDDALCGLSGTHIYEIAALGPGNGTTPTERWEALIDGSPVSMNGVPAIASIPGSYADTGANLPYDAAELTLNNDVEPSSSDTLGPYKFTIAFTTQPAGTSGWRDSTSATVYRLSSYCPPWNLLKGSTVNSFTVGFTGGACASNGSSAW